MSSYADIYLSDAMRNLGEAFDYAVNDCGFSEDDFINEFVTSGIADSFGQGDPKYVSGMSGTELVMDAYDKSRSIESFPAPKIDYERSEQYWLGWILAYYQWKSERSYKDIKDNFAMSDLIKLYPTLHEATEDKFVDILEERIKQKKTNKLQIQRKIRGLSQRELSEKSGVNLRTLQQYETGAKDISKASVASVIAMARVLGCNVMDIV